MYVKKHQEKNCCYQCLHLIILTCTIWRFIYRFNSIYNSYIDYQVQFSFCFLCYQFNSFKTSGIFWTFSLCIKKRINEEAELERLCKLFSPSHQQIAVLHQIEFLKQPSHGNNEYKAIRQKTNIIIYNNNPLISWS